VLVGCPPLSCRPMCSLDAHPRVVPLALRDSERFARLAVVDASSLTGRCGEARAAATAKAGLGVRLDPGWVSCPPIRPTGRDPRRKPRRVGKMNPNHPAVSIPQYVETSVQLYTRRLGSRIRHSQSTARRMQASPPTTAQPLRLLEPCLHLPSIHTTNCTQCAAPPDIPIPAAPHFCLYPLRFPPR
jgi:hypothetical protein